MLDELQLSLFLILSAVIIVTSVGATIVNNALTFALPRKSNKDEALKMAWNKFWGNK
jgi:hypothetical protein